MMSISEETKKLCEAIKTAVELFENTTGSEVEEIVFVNRKDYLNVTISKNRSDCKEDA